MGGWGKLRVAGCSAGAQQMVLVLGKASGMWEPNSCGPTGAGRTGTVLRELPKGTWSS